MTANNSKILFVNPAGWLKESVNLGLAYLSASLRAAGYDVLTLDLNRYEMEDSDLLNRVRAYAPAIVGVSVKTANANEAARLANILKPQVNEGVFIAGGPHVTIGAESFMTSFPVFDYGIMGEAEYSIVELVGAILNNQRVDAIHGVVYRKGGHVVVNPWNPPDDLDGLIMPDLESVVGFAWKDFRYPVVTSRGCPFDCIYCCVNKLTGSRKWRARSAGSVVDELEYIARKKFVRAFEVLDDNFSLDMDRAKDICREIIRRKLDLTWQCLNGIRADRLDMELAVLMQKAGCTSIAFGIETGDAGVFKEIKKGQTLQDIENAIKLVREAGMRAGGHFIIGLPGDNIDKFIQTVQFQRSLRLDFHLFGMLVPYPKTEVWDIVSKRGAMLCDITNTQHFNSDIVNISFELPEFPAKEMARAFYISRYYILFKTVRDLLEINKLPTVVYYADTATVTCIEGMIIACDKKARHVILCANKDKGILSDFSSKYIPEGAQMSVEQTYKNADSSEPAIIICRPCQLNLAIIFSNTFLVLIEPGYPRLILFRKRLTARRLMPAFIVGVVGLLVLLPHAIREAGMLPIVTAIKNQIKLKLLALGVMS